MSKSRCAKCRLSVRCLANRTMENPFWEAQISEYPPMGTRMPGPIGGLLYVYIHMAQRFSEKDFSPLCFLFPVFRVS